MRGGTAVGQAAPVKKWPKADYQVLVDALEGQGLSVCPWGVHGGDTITKWMPPDHGIGGAYEFSRINVATTACADVYGAEAKFSLAAYGSDKQLKKAVTVAKVNAERASSTDLIAWRYDPWLIVLNHDANPNTIAPVVGALKALPRKATRLYDNR